ncbi:hypothetical protein COCMIDRAFT_82953 [Bipolaris oryzae ATCC 44560]|uniref:Tyrosinase copper-binding domain-containing protein n=1 Tax=Bipolaris oryzae ATCC 44560 TaxID=930090 RepID=W6ZDT4_COCMI|nr:uncharacterized protein COCMIDRAFT_82953 [Bipolaris oryzae ATCC 44560]EUC50002.1 hypothetical protein COCMIDRAFT_82953 [Bipolaris oryzae ATCC 44560]
MVKLQVITSALSLASLAFAAALPAPHVSTCKKPAKRLEWRQMSTSQKHSYISAVLCLQKIPSISGFPYAKNRYDDFQAIHHDQGNYIHWVGFFLPWHRYFVWAYEQTLRNECGYKGAQPYWDYTLDADPQNLNSTRIYETDIFSPTLGFGGNGPRVIPTPEQNPLGVNNTGGGCIQDGPFVPKNFMLNFPGPEPQCLRRDFSPNLLNRGADPKVAENILSKDTYVAFDRALQGAKNFINPNIHAAGHFGVGGVFGQAGDVKNSPGEPLFWLHHASIDRLWWLWQQGNLATRNFEIGGNLVPEVYGNETEVTPKFEIQLGAVAGTVALAKLLDARGEVFCYSY